MIWKPGSKYLGVTKGRNDGKRIYPLRLPPFIVFPLHQMGKCCVQAEALDEKRREAKLASAEDRLRVGSRRPSCTYCSGLVMFDIFFLLKPQQNYSGSQIACVFSTMFSLSSPGKFVVAVGLFLRFFLFDGRQPFRVSSMTRKTRRRRNLVRATIDAFGAIFFLFLRGLARVRSGSVRATSPTLMKEDKKGELRVIATSLALKYMNWELEQV